MNSTFSTADGLELAYYVDDFTDPWRKPARSFSCTRQWAIPGAGFSGCRRCRVVIGP